MSDSAHLTLAGWSNFYLITGSAAAALTGLQFVVQTLLASDVLRPSLSSNDPESGIAAFGSPTVVHFSLALLVSAVVCAPWREYTGLRIVLGALATGALIYSVVVMRRTQRQEIYKPVFEDWLWHVILPIGSYTAILLAAFLVDGTGSAPFFALAAATLLLICVGIHNAWDTVTYLSVNALRKTSAFTPSAPPPRGHSGKRNKRRH